MINIAKRELFFNNDEKLIIEKNGFSYTIPCQWAISGDGDVDYRLDANQRAFSHGATVGGDRKVKSKTVDIDVIVKGTTKEEHDNIVNEVYRYFGQKDYRLFCGRQDRIYNVSGVQKIKQKYIKSFKQKMSDITLTLLLADPFRYGIQKKVITEDLYEAVTEKVIEVINDGNVEIPLIITLTPAISMPDVLIEHMESGYSCRVRDSLLTNPASLVIDTKNGTVRRGYLNAINTFNGQFLMALPGMNLYKITSDAGNISFSYHERWLL